MFGVFWHSHRHKMALAWRPAPFASEMPPFVMMHQGHARARATTTGKDSEGLAIGAATGELIRMREPQSPAPPVGNSVISVDRFGPPG